jgi:hypothetical protein
VSTVEQDRKRAGLKEERAVLMLLVLLLLVVLLLLLLLLLLPLSFILQHLICITVSILFATPIKV